MLGVGRVQIANGVIPWMKRGSLHPSRSSSSSIHWGGKSSFVVPLNQVRAKVDFAESKHSLWEKNISH